MEWVPNDAFGGVKSMNAEAEGHDSDGESPASVKEEERVDFKEEPTGAITDADMDVAEDEDQWL